MNKYRKKPIIVTAIQYTGDNLEECLAFCGGRYIFDGIMIKTLEGNMQANPGDYIIQGVKGEFYPCREDIFKATYDKVD